MKGIGGNIVATVQVCTGTTKNEIGELVKTWADAQTIRGWLDLQSGDSRYNNFSAKIQESTHIFIADYVELDARIKAESSRLLIGSGDAALQYDILLIDNPMELKTGSQLEFYLRFTGGQ